MFMVFKVILNRSGGRREDGGVVSYRSDHLPQATLALIHDTTEGRCVKNWSITAQAYSRREVLPVFRITF